MPDGCPSLAFAIAADAIAKGFVANLARDLTALEWQTMRIRNRSAADGICASHDFMDANEPMAEAIADVLGRPVALHEDTPESEAQAQADARLWNQAWELAAPSLRSIPGDWSTAGEAFDEWRCTGQDVDKLARFEELVGTVEGDNGGRIYSCGFVEYVPYGAGVAILCVCGNADILTQSLYEAECFLWDNHVSSETRTS